MTPHTGAKITRRCRARGHRAFTSLRWFSNTSRTCSARWREPRRSRHLSPFVVVMKPTDFRHRHHPATCRKRDRARLWTIHGQRQMGSPAMVIGKVAGQDALEMPLMEDDHMVQTLAANTPNQPLNKGVLPWTPWGDQDFFDPQVPHALLKGRSIYVITIAQQVSRDVAPRKRLQHLLGCPLCGGMLGDIDVHDTASLMAQDQQHKQHLVGRRRDGEEVEGHEVLPVIVQKRLP